MQNQSGKVEEKIPCRADLFVAGEEREYVDVLECVSIASPLTKPKIPEVIKSEIKSVSES